VKDEWEARDFIGCKEVAFVPAQGTPRRSAGHTTPRAAPAAAHSKPHQTPKPKPQQQQRAAAWVAEEADEEAAAPLSPASMARQIERELRTERGAAQPLDSQCRAHALLGKIVWAPPADEDGWEKVRVEAFHKRREHPYDVVYLWSENPEHGFGERDEWESCDFDLCRDIGDFDDVASPGGGSGSGSGKAYATARKGSGGKSSKRAREGAAAAARPAQRKRVVASASAAKAALPRAPQTNLRTPAAVAKRKRAGSSAASSSAPPRSGARSSATGPRPKKSRKSSSASAAAAGRGERNLSVKGSAKVAKKAAGSSIQVQGRPLFQESSTLSVDSSAKDIGDVVTSVFGINHLGTSLPARRRELGRINLFMRTNLEKGGRGSARAASAATFSEGALFVAGPPGTGKTATVDFALKHMAKLSGLGRGGYATIRLNCMLFSSAKLMVEHIVAAYALQRDAGFGSAALSPHAVSKKATALRKQWRGSDATPIERMRTTFSGKAAKVRCARLRRLLRCFPPRSASQDGRNAARMCAWCVCARAHPPPFCPLLSLLLLLPRPPPSCKPDLAGAGRGRPLQLIHVQRL
jgi:hypothetical protein